MYLRNVSLSTGHGHGHGAGERPGDADHLPHEGDAAVGGVHAAGGHPLKNRWHEMPARRRVRRRRHQSRGLRVEVRQGFNGV